MLAHSSERVNSDSEADASKVEIQKMEAQYSCLLPQKPKEIYSASRKSMVTRKQQSTKSSTKDVNLGTITDTLPFYKISPLSGIRVKPKLHRRRRRIHESLQKPSQKPKVTHTYNLLEFGKYCEEFSWYYRTATLHRSETSGIAERAVRRAKRDISRIIAIWIG